MTKQKKIVEDFLVFQLWIDRYTYLMALSNDLKKMNEIDMCEKNLLKNCMSKVFFKIENRSETLHFEGYSDSVIMRGILSIFQQSFDGEKLSEIKNEGIYFPKVLGFYDNFPSQRMSGINQIVDRILNLE